MICCSYILIINFTFKEIKKIIITTVFRRYFSVINVVIVGRGRPNMINQIPPLPILSQTVQLMLTWKADNKQ